MEINQELEAMFEDAFADAEETTEVEAGQEEQANTTEEQETAAGAKGEAEAEETSTETDAEAEAEEAEAEAEEAAEPIPFKHLDQRADLDGEAVAKIAEALCAKTEDVVSMLQKGMDYDRVRERLAGYDRYRDTIERVERFGGAERAAELFRQVEEQDAIQAVLAENPGLSEEAAFAAARERVKMAQPVEKQESPWVKFFVDHPDASVKEIPDDLLVQISFGSMTPGEAWLHVENRKQQAEIERIKKEAAQEKKAAENKRKQTGSLKGSGEAKSDPFLDGFLEGFN